MKSFNYPLTVFLKDPTEQNDLPLSLNLIGEAETTSNVGGQDEKSKLILALENNQWYPIEFILNNYICTPL